MEKSSCSVSARLNLDEVEEAVSGVYHPSGSDGRPRKSATAEPVIPPPERVIHAG